jgi:hypothetical protein
MFKGRCKLLASSVLVELVTLELSLEVDLSEVGVVGRLGLDLVVEVEESCASEVDLPRVVNEEVDDELFSTAATASHLL